MTREAYQTSRAALVELRDRHLAILIQSGDHPSMDAAKDYNTLCDAIKHLDERARSLGLVSGVVKGMKPR